MLLFINYRHILLQILNLLQEGGAERSNYFSDFVTHLIAGNEALENDISEAKDLYEIPAVTQNWILYSVKCNKLLPYPFMKDLYFNILHVHNIAHILAVMIIKLYLKL